MKFQALSYVESGDRLAIDERYNLLRGCGRRLERQCTGHDRKHKAGKRPLGPILRCSDFHWNVELPDAARNGILIIPHAGDFCGT